jgi:zinc protease
MSAMPHAAHGQRGIRSPALRMARWLAGVLLLGTGTGALAALPIQHWTTGSGARVYFVESRGLPILDVSVEFPAGSSRDTPASSGLASLALHTMRMGAAGMHEEEVSRRLANVAARLGTTFDVDRAGYTLRVLSLPAQREDAVAVLAQILAQPEFDAGVLEREKARVTAGLREAEMKPDQIAARNFAHMVYRDHPYALRAAGEVATVQGLTSADLEAFHASFYRASDAVVAIIGDVGREEAAKIAESLTAGLPQGQGMAAAPPPLAPLPEAALRAVEYPSAQAHILLGAPGMRRMDPDYFPLWVGNYVLGGGGFNSRFTQEVREKRGLSYSVYSSFAPYRQYGAFTIGLQTRRDQSAAALEVVRRTLREFVAQGPTPEELAGAKQHIIGGFALRTDSNRKILDYLAVIGFYGLPLDYLEQFPRRVEEVTVEQIRDAFRRRIDPERLAAVVVGAGARAAAPP